MVPELKRCPICQTVLPASAPAGFCPTCEFRAALGHPMHTDATNLFGAAPRPEKEVPLLSELKKIRYFGDFELLEEIASGGMGTVFKARQIPLNRVVALKLISAGVLASQDLVKRFKVEAELAAGLNHANIVPIHEIGEHEGRHYFCMAFIEGPTLGTALGRKPMETQRAAQLVTTLARAIHYAHQRGVLHRDLKPSNVLLNTDGEPHLTDFGLAKLIEHESTLTHTNAVLGTPAYMSPEQARGDSKEVTTATDVYGLGAILYETLAGDPPFGRGTSLETIRQVLDEEPRRPSLFNAVDRDLETICLKCLEKEPSRRYATALGLAEDLDRWMRHEPIHARPVTTWEKMGKWSRRKPGMAVSLASAAFLLLILAIGGPIMALQILGERTRLEKSLYVSNVRLAAQALAEHDIIHTREWLQRIADSPLQRKLRGWEYRYLMGRCHSDELTILGRHDSWISGLALSPDDKWAASISADGVVKLWDFAARKEAQSWPAHAVVAKYKPEIFTHALTFSPDSQILATGGADWSVRLWKVKSPERPTAELEKLDGDCTGLAFSRDGRMLAASSANGQIRLWNVTNETFRLMSRWKADAWGTYALAFSADNQNLVTAAIGLEVRIWDVSQPQSVRPLPGFTGATAPAGFSSDGRWLVSADSSAHFLRGWDYANRTERPRWSELSASIATLAFSPNGLTLASGLTDGEIVLWDFDGGREPVSLMGHEGGVVGLAFSSNGQLLLSASQDKTVRLWEVSPKDLSHRAISHGLSSVGVCFSADSYYLASVAYENSPTSDERQHTLKLWETRNLTEVTNVSTGGGSLNSYPTFSPDGQYLVAEDWGRSLKLYRIPSLELVTNLSGFAPAFSKDGNRFVYTSGRRLIRRDTPASPDAVEIDVGEVSTNICSMALSPDGKTLASADLEDNGMSIQFWDVDLRCRLGPPATGQEGHIGKLAFAPDGQRLASAGWDHKVGIWDVKKRRLIKLLSGHNGDLYSVAFSPDGRTLASSGEDGTVRLWSMVMLEEVGSLRPKARLGGIAFSPDGQWLAAPANDGVVHVWQAP